MSVAIVFLARIAKGAMGAAGLKPAAFNKK